MQKNLFPRKMLSSSPCISATIEQWATMEHWNPVAKQLQRAFMHCDAARREAYELKKERDELRVEVAALRALASNRAKQSGA